MQSSRIKIVTYVAVNAILAAGIAALAFGIARFTREAGVAKREIETLSLIASQVATLRETSRPADEALGKLREMLPDTEKLLFISSELESMATRFGLDFFFQYGSVDEGPPRSILFTMSVSGTSAGLLAYLDALGKEPTYRIRVMNADFSRAEAGKYRGVMTGNIYIR